MKSLILYNRQEKRGKHSNIKDARYLFRLKNINRRDFN